MGNAKARGSYLDRKFNPKVIKDKEQSDSISFDKLPNKKPLTTLIAASMISIADMFPPRTGFKNESLRKQQFKRKSSLLRKKK